MTYSTPGNGYAEDLSGNSEHQEQGKNATSGEEHDDVRKSVIG